MADDFTASTVAPGTLVPGGNAGGNLEVADDRDWFAIGLTAGLDYQFSLSAAPGTTNPTDLDVSLRNDTGVLVAGSGSADKVVSYVPPITGTYYVDVGSYRGDSIGAYTLTASPTDDYTASASTSGRLLVGGATIGKLEAINDIDWFAVSVSAGFNYQFNVSAIPGLTGAANLDVTLEDVNGTTVSGSGSADKVVTYKAPDNAALYLRVTSYGGASIGSYSLTSTPADDFTANTSTGGRVPVRGVASGTLEGFNDTDWFATALTTGLSYKFDLAAIPGFSGASNLDVSVYNVNGMPVDGTGSADKTVTFTPTATDTYYVAVTSYGGGSTGGYSINSSTLGEPVYRFFDSKTGTQFLTSNVGERNTVLATRPDLKNEGTGLGALSGPGDPNATPVYRFFDRIYGTHFFTSSVDEYNTILATRADLKFESISFYEYSSSQPGTTPVYRFFDSVRGTHFFTSSESEKATVILTRPDLVPEGISFYSPTATT